MEWKPIETAPKDGTRVLLYGSLTWPNGISPQMDDIEPIVFEAYYDHGWQGKGMYQPVPTHWMQMPQPPSRPTKPCDCVDLAKECRCADDCKIAMSVLPPNAGVTGA